MEKLNFRFDRRKSSQGNKKLTGSTEALVTGGRDCRVARGLAPRNDGLALFWFEYKTPIVESPHWAFRLCLMPFVLGV